MDIVIQIVSIGIVVMLLSVIVKKLSKDIGMLISIGGGILIFFIIIPYLSGVLGIMTTLTEHIDTDMTHLNTIFKVLGIAYIAEFGAQLCKDAGEGAIASKIELGGKVMIMAISAPIIISFLNLILTLLP